MSDRHSGRGNSSLTGTGRHFAGIQESSESQRAGIPRAATDGYVSRSSLSSFLLPNKYRYSKKKNTLPFQVHHRLQFSLRLVSAVVVNNASELSKGQASWLRMSTPNLFPQPTFFPTRAIMCIIKSKPATLLLVALTGWLRCLFFRTTCFLE